MLSIGNVIIGEGQPCFVIAEIGQNHQGNLSIARQMVKVAAECGVSCVKFQKTGLPHRFTRTALQAPYSGPNSFGNTYGAHRAHRELSRDDFKVLQQDANDLGILFASSCMDIPSADFLKDLGVPFMKIGSGDTNNPILIEHVARMQIPIILSTGMSSQETVTNAVDIIRKYHNNLALLHCVSAYPTPPNDVNLSVMSLYRSLFPNVAIGYSGHEKGIAIAIAAVALGAKLIEKHFTLDKTMKGTDHASSVDPAELKALVTGIREVEAAIGVPQKFLAESELPCQLNPSPVT